MLKNEKEYQFTKTQRDGFLGELEILKEMYLKIDPIAKYNDLLLLKAQKDALESVLEDLKKEMKEYEDKKDKTNIMKEPPATNIMKEPPATRPRICAICEMEKMGDFYKICKESTSILVCETCMAAIVRMGNMGRKY